MFSKDSRRKIEPMDIDITSLLDIHENQQGSLLTITILKF